MSKVNTSRAAANTLFLQALSARNIDGVQPFTPAQSRAFRAAVVQQIEEVAACTHAAACTHYAWALNRIKASEPEILVGLGRAEGKNNGGRKRKQADAAETPASDLTPDLGEPQQVFEVKRCKDGETLAQGLCFEDAKALVEKHAAQKKAKLYWI